MIKGFFHFNCHKRHHGPDALLGEGIVTPEFNLVVVNDAGKRVAFRALDITDAKNTVPRVLAIDAMEHHTAFVRDALDLVLLTKKLPYQMVNAHDCRRARRQGHGASLFPGSVLFLPSILKVESGVEHVEHGTRIIVDAQAHEPVPI
ncbi:MAG: hypothetical protein AABY13_05470, partial [Nanoarchaeota archaeon]